MNKVTRDRIIGIAVVELVVSPSYWALTKHGAVDPNLVERCFNKLKNARRVATRYDKTAESFLRFIDITSIRLWIRLLSK